MSWSTSLVIAIIPVVALAAAGCIDEHHLQDPHRVDAHHEDPHHDPHYETAVVHQSALPPAPSHPPANATGAGRWVWDPQRSQYLWVQP